MNEQIDFNYDVLLAHANDCGNAFSVQGQVQICYADALIAIPQDLNPADLATYFEADSAVAAELALPFPLRQLLWEFHSGKCLLLLDQLLAMEGLLPDPQTSHGGYIVPGNTALQLEIPHALPRLGLDHRLSLLACLQEAVGQTVFIGAESDDHQQLACAAGQVMLLKNVAGCRLEFRPPDHSSASPRGLFLLLHYYAQVENMPGI